MPLWLACLIAIVCAILAFLYLPAPLNWIIGGAILVATAVYAFRATTPGRRV
jgi:uncharacterized membrane protein